MNNKGQAIFAGIMIFFMVLIAIVVLIEPLKDMIDLSRDSSHLDCDNSSITTYQKGTCVVVDAQLMYFVGMCLAAAGSYISGRWLQSKGLI